ncbi:hypothetical protein IW261DRAFT_1423471 [Armillaria novae-zelandiae]|uniref:Uncharacterized protein n=1 Tax=Armillaria novae-zelandiae TaxID=153914 RepID=A0AA39NXN6_9AGAR|nr:hypothetical protein IW261DRAFT_1423471 [Armillaria novae-zelandiae]
MAPLTRSKGPAPSLDLPPRGGTKKAYAASAELPFIQSKANTDLLGDEDSPLTSMASLRPDNSVRSSGPNLVNEKGLSSLPFKEESVASDDFDLSGDLGGRSFVNEPTTTGYDTALETDLLDLREESVILHPDDIKGWKKVGKTKGRCTPSPDPSSNSAGFSASTQNKFDVLSELEKAGNEVTIEKTVKFVHGERQKFFEKWLGDLLNQFEVAREQRRVTDVNNTPVNDKCPPEEPGDRPLTPLAVNKGKVREFRDTGIPGIDNSELDPENQRRAWENFDFLRNEDPELQRIIYEGIVTTILKHVLVQVTNAQKRGHVWKLLKKPTAMRNKHVLKLLPVDGNWYNHKRQQLLVM